VPDSVTTLLPHTFPLEVSATTWPLTGAATVPVTVAKDTSAAQLPANVAVGVTAAADGGYVMTVMLEPTVDHAPAPAALDAAT